MYIVVWNQYRVEAVGAVARCKVVCLGMVSGLVGGGCNWSVPPLWLGSNCTEQKWVIFWISYDKSWW